MTGHFYIISVEILWIHNHRTQVDEPVAENEIVCSLVVALVKSMHGTKYITSRRPSRNVNVSRIVP